MMEFGFQVKGDFPKAFSDIVSNSASMVASTLNISPEMVGSGIRLSIGDATDVSVDQMMNIVDIKLTRKFDTPTFAYLWALALHKFNFIENYEETVNQLIYTTLTQKEFNERIIMRWKNAEIGIQGALESVFEKADDLAAVKQAMQNFHGSLDGAMANTTEATARSIRKLESAAEALGCEANSETKSLLAMLISMRADCTNAIQDASRLNDNAIRAKISYFARMDLLAETNGSDHFHELAPAFAISAFVAKQLGETCDFADPSFMPNDYEMEEIALRMPIFTSEIKRKQESIFDAGNRRKSHRNSLK